MKDSKGSVRLLVCVKERISPTSPSCAARGSGELLARLDAELTRRGHPGRVEIINCFGQCNRGPNMRIAPGGRFFYGVGPDRLDEVITALEEALAVESVSQGRSDP
ncbi:MAG: (2Fe-2S) ferredoxin domain-containing protein [Magnetococcales bacterium]|nr:(2Fe-2S) ferredoxin domain-containing protein [Magnetococcales bacterium]